MPGVTKETARWLKWKSVKYLASHDQEGKIRRHVLKHPFRYGFHYLKSIFAKRSYKREGDFFLYGISSLESFEQALQDESKLLITGFSYCQKPHECPSKRFTDNCQRDPNHPVCRQCDIGKTLHAFPQARTIPLIIPTIHYIGDKIFELVELYGAKRLLFLITACEMTLKMFGDLGNMVQIQGVGVRLDGRICNTMKAFELSEKGIKPGLTVTQTQTQQRILHLARSMRAQADVSVGRDDF